MTCGICTPEDNLERFSRNAQATNWIEVTETNHYLLREANSFARAKLKENCGLRGTDNVQGQISEHIFAPNEGYCLCICYRSNLYLGNFF